MRYSLIIHLSSPMQAWGMRSLFQRRSAGTAPTKSAICGMVCAALGVEKQSEEEKAVIREFNSILMSSFSPCHREKAHGCILRDFHTVQNTRAAKDKQAKQNTVVTEREYWLDRKFIVLLESANKTFLEQAAEALRNPKWGIWFGRKCCIPAEPLIQEDILSAAEARDRIFQDVDHDKLEIYSEVEKFDSSAELWNDAPVSFGRADSSGREERCYGQRAVRHVTPIAEGRDFFAF